MQEQRKVCEIPKKETEISCRTLVLRTNNEWLITNDEGVPPARNLDYFARQTEICRTVWRTQSHPYREDFQAMSKASNYALSLRGCGRGNPHP